MQAYKLNRKGVIGVSFAGLLCICVAVYYVLIFTVLSPCNESTFNCEEPVVMVFLAIAPFLLGIPVVIYVVYKLFKMRGLSTFEEVNPESPPSYFKDEEIDEEDSEIEYE